MANAYMQVEELKATRTLTGTTFADSDVELAIDAASRGIEGVTGRRFWQDPEPGSPPYPTRYYTARSAGLVLIDDLSYLDSVTVSGAAWTETTDFLLEPFNAAADERPWSSLVAVSRSFPATSAAIAVSGLFGWAAVPSPIKQATGILAARLMLRHREAPWAVMFGPDGTGVARIAKSDPDVMFLIDPYIEGILVA